MPFVHDETEIDLPDEDAEPAPPRPDQFVYIAAPQFGGARDPVRFDVPQAEAPMQPVEPDRPLVANLVASAEPPAPQRRSFWQRLLGRPPAVGGVQAYLGLRIQHIQDAKRDQGQRLARLLSIMVPALRQIGGRRVYCRYDGGNDEGWAWFDSLELQDGERMSLETLAQRLRETEVPAKLSDAGLKLDHPEGPEGAVNWLCSEWASMLLGRGFGTGEYSMYGAFTVDLDTCTITDDPNADPVVENIRIAR